MPFDPKAYLKESDSSAFDPKAYLSQDNGMKVLDIAKPAQAALEHYGNMATGGYLPHIQAKVFSLLPDPNKELDEKLRAQGVTIVENKPSYVELRDENIKRLDQQVRDNPTASAVGMGTGILANSLLLNKFVPMSKAKTAWQRIKNAAKTGGMIGAMQNPGDIEGELHPLQPGERISNAAFGAATGAGTQGLFEGAGKVAQKVSGSFGRAAEEKAAKAAGFRKPDLDKAAKQGTLSRTGRNLLDEGVVTAGASPSVIAERIGAKITENESKLAGLIDEVEKKLGNQKFWKGLAPKDRKAIIEASFKPQKEVEAIQKAIQSKYSEIPPAKLQGALDEVQAWLGEKGKVLGIRSLQDMKVQMNRFLKDSDFWRQPASFSKEGTLAVRKSLKEGVERKADALAQVLGKKGGDIKKTNQVLGSLFETEQTIQDRINRLGANRTLSPSDYGMGALGSTLGALSGDSPEDKVKNAMIGFSLAGANKLGRTYGPQFQAATYNAIAKRLGQVPALARTAGKNPGMTQGVIQSLTGKLTGRGSFEEGLGISQDPDVIDYFQKRPQLLDNVQDPKIRAEIKKEIERRPAQNAVERRLKSR